MQDRYDFTLLDRYVSLAESAKVDLLLPLALSPSWASARPAEASAYLPGNASEPRSVIDWEDYVGRVATRYRGRVHAYEVWNEPNLSRFFSGSVERMLELSKTAYRTIKAIDSTAIVVSPAPTGQEGIRWLREFVAGGGLSYADVVGYHFYVRQQDAPEAMAPLVREVRSVISRGSEEEKEIWNTETGWTLLGRQVPPPSWVSRSWDMTNGLDSTRAAATVCRAYLVGLVEGLGRFYWYSWDHYAMGLVEPDGSTLKPAGNALRRLEGWLVGARIVRTSAVGGIWSVVVERPGQRPAAIVWCPDASKEWKTPADWKAARSEGVLGHTTTYTSGQSRVTVGPLPQLIEALGTPR